MTGVNETSGPNRPGESPARRLRHIYQWVSLGLLLILAILVFVINSALSGPSSTDTRSAGSTNVGQAAPGAVANPNPVATPAPVQTDPAPVPPGLSPAETLDWRLVQWDKLTDNGVNDSVQAPELGQTTQGWIDIINKWIYYLPSSAPDGVGQFWNRPWAADGVVMGPNSEFYPKLVNGIMQATQIGSTGDASSADLPGAQVRFYYSELVAPGASMGEKRTFKLMWHKSSDGVGHVLVTSCKGDVPSC
jgi:hypothetical protein